MSNNSDFEFYTMLLHEADTHLDYWQDKLLTGVDSDHVLRKIKNTKISLQRNYLSLEGLQVTANSVQ